MLHWLIFMLLQAFLTCRDNLIKNRVLCVTNWPLSTNVSHTPISCMHPFSHKWDISAYFCSYQIKHYLCWFIHNMIILNVCVIGDEVLNDFGISFLS